MPPSFLTSLLSGCIAGISVDVALFPLDTIKTRLQSPKGFVGEDSCEDSCEEDEDDDDEAAHKQALHKQRKRVSKE